MNIPTTEKASRESWLYTMPHSATSSLETHPSTTNVVADIDRCRMGARKLMKNPAAQLRMIATEQGVSRASTNSLTHEVASSIPSSSTTPAALLSSAMPTWLMSTKPRRYFCRRRSALQEMRLMMIHAMPCDALGETSCEYIIAPDRIIAIPTHRKSVSVSVCRMIRSEISMISGRKFCAITNIPSVTSCSASREVASEMRNRGGTERIHVLVPLPR
mmetsp:Transcript_19515/g.44801  ORF Transcript_19515/g.44801 Transcript_19515/m.44801 type:complete len:217 (-) Transcript_19515:212-862(-)